MMQFMLEAMFVRHPYICRALTVWVALYLFGAVMQAMNWVNGSCVMLGLIGIILLVIWLRIQVDKIP